MSINDLEIEENLKIKLNSLLEEFEAFKKGETINFSQEKIETEIVVEVPVDKVEKKSLLNGFFRKFFTTEYEFQ